MYVDVYSFVDKNSILYATHLLLSPPQLPTSNAQHPDRCPAATWTKTRWTATPTVRCSGHSTLPQMRGVHSKLLGTHCSEIFLLNFLITLFSDLEIYMIFRPDFMSSRARFWTTLGSLFDPKSDQKHNFLKSVLFGKSFKTIGVLCIFPSRIPWEFKHFSDGIQKHYGFEFVLFWKSSKTVIPSDVLCAANAIQVIVSGVRKLPPV